MHMLVHINDLKVSLSKLLVDINPYSANVKNVVSSS